MHYSHNNNSTTLPTWLFERVCPALVYQLAAESSSERNGCIRVPENYKPAVSMDKFYSTEDSVRNTVKGILLKKKRKKNEQSATINLTLKIHHFSLKKKFNQLSLLLIPVWVYSTVSIFIISLSGLLGVVVIPVMGKNYYHHVLQFLVALAVGTLTGDALIHLLPHVSFFLNVKRFARSN